MKFLGISLVTVLSLFLTGGADGRANTTVKYQIDQIVNFKAQASLQDYGTFDTVIHRVANGSVGRGQVVTACENGSVGTGGPRAYLYDSGFSTYYNAWYNVYRGAFYRFVPGSGTICQAWLEEVNGKDKRMGIVSNIVTFTGG